METMQAVRTGQTGRGNDAFVGSYDPVNEGT